MTDNATNSYSDFTWALLCPIESYSLSRGISAGDKETPHRDDFLLINAKVRHPSDLFQHRIQIDLWKDYNLSSNRPGALQFLEKCKPDEENTLCASQPTNPQFFEDIVMNLLQSELISTIKCEICLKGSGRLKDWDKKERIKIITFEFILFKTENSTSS